MISRISFLKKVRKKTAAPAQEAEPEMNILFHSIAAAGNRHTLIGEIIKKGIDWSKLEELALYHKVLPLLYNQLTKIADSLLPRQEMERIKALYKSNALRNLRQAQSLLNILELLSQKGIAVIPFKGPALAMQAYNDLSLRIFTDLDFLMRTEDFPGIYDIITAAGFRGVITLDDKMKKYWMLFRRDSEYSSGVSGIDFHHQITQGPERISLKEKAWQDRISIELLSRKIPSLSVEHSLLCLCIHGCKEHWMSLRSIADIAHLISRNPGLDWESLTTDAEEIGCLRMLMVGLRLTGQVCPLPLPEKIAESVQAHRRAGKLAAKYLQMVLTGKQKPGKFNEISGLIKSMDSAGPRLKLLAHFIFTPTPLDWKAIKLPPALYPLYYFIRPMRLFFKFLSLPFNYKKG